VSAVLEKVEKAIVNEVQREPCCFSVFWYPSLPFSLFFFFFSFLCPKVCA